MSAAGCAVDPASKPRRGRRCAARGPGTDRHPFHARANAQGRVDARRTEPPRGHWPPLSAQVRTAGGCRDRHDSTGLPEWPVMALVHNATRRQPWPAGANSAQGRKGGTPNAAGGRPPSQHWPWAGSATGSGDGQTSCPSTRARISRANRLASSKVADLPKPSSWPMNTRGAVSSAWRNR